MTYSALYTPTPIDYDEVYKKYGPPVSADGGNFFTNNLSLLRMIITIGEVGLFLLAPIFGWNLGWIAQVLIGLGAASINTLASHAANSLSASTAALDYTAALIPFITGLGRGVVTNKRLVNAFASRFKDMRLREYLEFINKPLVQRVAKYKKHPLEPQLTAIESRIKKMRVKTSFKRITALQYIEKKEKLISKKILQNLTQPEKYRGVTNSFIKTYESRAIKNANAFRKSSAKLRQYYYKRTAVIKKIENVQKLNKADRSRAWWLKKDFLDTYKQIENIPFVKKMSRQQYVAEIEKLSPENLKNYMANTFSTIVSVSEKQNFKVLNTKLRNRGILALASDQLSKQGKELFGYFMRRYRFLRINPTETIKDAKALMNALPIADQKLIAKHFDTETFEKLFLSYSSQGLKVGGFRSTIKFLGSRKFNDKYIQNLQLIDPNDFGRMIPERTYQHYKKKIYRYYENNAFHRAAKAGVKNLKSTQSVREAFIKSGGHFIKSGKQAQLNSRYLWGMKVLPIGGKDPSRLYVMIVFNKLNARAKYSGKNLGGKKNIIVPMTRLDFTRMLEHGSDYWFQVGQRKGWFVSRGGKRVMPHSFRVLTNRMSLFLGFVPIPALRFVLSGVTNWMENIYNISSGGDYFDKWFTKFNRAFARTSLSRISRLTTKVIIGSRIQTKAVAKAVQGIQKKGNKDYYKMVMAATDKARQSTAWIGRELQRVSTTLISTFTKTTPDGHFAFTSGATRSRTAFESLARTTAFGASTVSLRSALIRQERKFTGLRGFRNYGIYRRSYGRELITTRLYASQITRIHSAFTPNTVVPSLRSITKIRRR